MTTKKVSQTAAGASQGEVNVVMAAAPAEPTQGGPTAASVPPEAGEAAVLAPASPKAGKTAVLALERRSDNAPDSRRGQ